MLDPLAFLPARQHLVISLNHFKLLEFLPDGKDCLRALAENLRTRERAVLAITPKREGVPLSYKVEGIAD